MEMDAPESLEGFREVLRAHYAKFPRFTAKLVKSNERERFSLDQVTDERVLDNFVRIHEESLDFEAMERLTAREIEAGIDRD